MTEGSFQPTPGSRLEPARSRNPGWVIVPVLIFAAIAGAFTFALKSADPSRLPSALIGRPVPDVTFPRLDELVVKGKQVSGFGAADLAKGKVTVVNFWASWCVPCATELPLLIELKKQADVNVFAVNYKDQPATARRFLDEYGNPFSAVGTDPKGRHSIEWGVYGMPETFVVGGDGKIVYKHIGEITAENLKEKLLPAIEAAKQAAASPPSKP
jgi:cytochrome c biogenesis protein CcmG, thiol:disulfide interchange protein DsbE